MTFRVRTWYMDSTGHPWCSITPVRTVQDGTRVFAVMPWDIEADRGVHEFEIAAIDPEDPTRATVLLDEGFTTLYSEIVIDHEKLREWVFDTEGKE